jgi:hypothetical protein
MRGETRYSVIDRATPPGGTQLSRGLVQNYSDPEQVEAYSAAKVELIPTRGGFFHAHVVCLVAL